MLWFPVIGFLAVIYLPFAMRSWRAFIALCIVYLMIDTGVRLGVATYSADDVPRFLVLAGNTWIDFLVEVLPATVIARALVLTAKSLGLSGRRLLAANIIGILALPGGIAGIAAHERWERRPAPLQCTSKQIPLVLSGKRATATWSKSTALFVGENIRDDGRYLLSPRHQRRICRDTSDGTKNLTIEAITFRTHNLPTSRCTAQDITPWELSMCENWKDDAWHRKPHEVIIFNPNGIRLGDFGIPNVPTNDGFQLDDNERLVSATSKNHATISAVCRVPTNSDRPLHCQMRRPIFEGISLYWEANLPRGKIEEYLLRTDEFARGVCLGLFVQPLCDTLHGKLP
ncbi:hypothetical protein [Ruegeria sp. HKCCD8929]|uniref:hypothetical protein n=1 Tax=Ruegeria sp. HKCCD8929 TaxID=2683006 RepID=UPI001488B46E|nr:hypothetical protein [Ruegeria sp. HKCCD8929]